jgi:DNA-binding NtrC family response regulator
MCSCQRLVFPCKPNSVAPFLLHLKWKTTCRSPVRPTVILCNLYYTVAMAHILLVDDNQTFVYAGREMLLHHRPMFAVDMAFDAETALADIRTHDYDVVVSDLVLPRLDGIALLYECHQIRPDTPVVLISGYGDVQLEQLAAQRGAYAFLHKPVDPDAFFSVVNRAVLRAQMRRRPEQVLGDDSVWYPQAVEQARRKSNAIAERLRLTIQKVEPPWKGTP